MTTVCITEDRELYVLHKALQIAQASLNQSAAIQREFAAIRRSLETINPWLKVEKQ